MQSVTVSRRFDASPREVEDAISDWAGFTRAAGFDDVDVDGDRIRVANRVGVKEIELELEVVDWEGASFAYEQRDGIFQEMWTTYTVMPHAKGDAADVEAVTEFSLGVPVVGDVLDSTVISRQRRRELDAQLDWLAETVA